MNKKVERTLFPMQEQGKATDYESVACTSAGHRDRVISAVAGYYQAQRQGKRRTGTGHRKPAKPRSLAGVGRRVLSAGPSASKQKAHPPLKSTTPQTDSSSIIHNTRHTIFLRGSETL